MTRSDAIFAAGCVVFSLVIPGLMLSRPVFGESGSTFGTLAGWGLALAVMVPSYVMLSRTIHAENMHRFHRAFMLGTALRFAGCIVGTLAFALLVPDAPILTFLMAFFLGYVLLTALELPLALRRMSPSERA